MMKGRKQTNSIWKPHYLKMSNVAVLLHVDPVKVKSLKYSFWAE